MRRIGHAEAGACRQRAAGADAATVTATVAATVAPSVAARGTLRRGVLRSAIVLITGSVARHEGALAARPAGALAAPRNVRIPKTYVRKTTLCWVRKTYPESRPFSDPTLAFTTLGTENGLVSRAIFRTRDGVVFCTS